MRVEVLASVRAGGHMRARQHVRMWAAVIIDKRRDHKRLAEERRRRRRCAAPQKKTGRRGRASLRARPRPGFFWGAARRRRGLRSDPDPAGVIINKRRDHKQKA